MCGKKYTIFSHNVEVSAHILKYLKIYFKVSSFIYWLVRWNPRVKRINFCIKKSKIDETLDFWNEKSVFPQQFCNKYSPFRDQDISSSGQKFELPKKSNFCPVELLSSNFFSVHMEAEELQKWQATHFKACSKWEGMKLNPSFYCFALWQKTSVEDELWMYLLLFIIFWVLNMLQARVE